MTPKERNQVRELAAKHKGDLDAAACEFLGLSDEFKANGKKVPNGNAGAVLNIVDEVERYADLDAEEANAAAATASAGDGGKGDAGSGE